MTPTTYSHEQVLDGAEGVWAAGDTVAVWMGGRTLNLYVQADDGWRSGSTHQWMEQPTREQARETAQQELPEGPA